MISTQKEFLDTNLFVYLYVDKDKQKVVKDILKNIKFWCISWQVINETNAVLLKKYKFSLKEIRLINQDFFDNFEIVAYDQELVGKWSEIMQKYKLSYRDSMIVASALKAWCSVLYSEDMQHGLIIDETLKIVNPFYIQDI